jgi:hypothetical protein
MPSSEQILRLMYGDAWEVHHVQLILVRRDRESAGDLCLFVTVVGVRHYGYRTSIKGTE